MAFGFGDFAFRSRSGNEPAQPKLIKTLDRDGLRVEVACPVCDETEVRKTEFLGVEDTRCEQHCCGSQVLELSAHCDGCECDFYVDIKL
jgi:hypothetical protein